MAHRPFLVLAASWCASAAPAGSSFVVLKRGHSGSTWFSTLLLDFEKTFFLDEAVSASGFAKMASPFHNHSAFEEYLLRALREPMGKFVRKKKRVEWDRQLNGTKACFKNPACDTTLWTFGLSLAPLGLGCRSHPAPWFPTVLDSLVLSRPSLKFVILLRTNVVKMSLSHMGDKKTLGTLPEEDRRLVEENPTLDPDDFFVKCLVSIIRNANLRALAPGHGAAVREVYYEALQLDTPGEMDKVRDFLGIPKRDDVKFVSTSVKLGTDDLRSRIANFDEVSASFAERSPCLHDMLHATVPLVHEPCPLPDGVNATGPTMPCHRSKVPLSTHETHRHDQPTKESADAPAGS